MIRGLSLSDSEFTSVALLTKTCFLIKFFGGKSEKKTYGLMSSVQISSLKPELFINFLGGEFRVFGGLFKIKITGFFFTWLFSCSEFDRVCFLIL